MSYDQPNFITDILYTPEQLQKRIAEMGEEISKDYNGRDLIVICVLKGAVFFATDLLKNFRKVQTDLNFMSISSYGTSTKSSGVVKILKDIDESIEDKDVLIVEDIVDTGLTLNYLVKTLRLRNPKSLKICSLLSKPARRQAEVEISYCGFEIPDRFVVGYGLDYKNYYRNLPYIGVLDPELEAKEA